MAPCAAVGEMQGVELQFYFHQHIENPPLVTEQGRQNWELFLVCEDLPFFLFCLVFWVCFLKSKAGTEAARSCQEGWARLKRISTGQWAGGAELPLVIGTVGQEDVQLSFACEASPV